MSVLCCTCSQINVKSVEDLDVIQEELLGVPLLLRVWAEHHAQNPIDASAPQIKWEGQRAQQCNAVSFNMRMDDNYMSR